MKKNGYIILFAFLLGILLANMFGKELFADFGILNTYYLNQYSYRNIDGDKLFGYVLVERGKVALLMMVGAKIVKQDVAFYLIEGILAVILGYILVVAIANLGVGGILIVLAALFPQWLFYQMALYLYLKFQGSRRSYISYGKTNYAAMGNRVIVIGVIILVFVVGIITESYVNPIFFHQILKFF